MVELAVPTVNSPDPYGVIYTLFAVVLFVLPIVGLAGTIFLWRVYRSDTNRPRSWVLLLLSVGATIVELASLAVGWLALRRLLGAEALPEGNIILGIAVVGLEAIPIWYAYSIWIRRRNGISDHYHEHTDEHEQE